MMDEYVVKLLPRSGMEGGFPSDTLFGAFSWAIRDLYGEQRLCEILDTFNLNPLFLLSSAFPFKEYGKQTRYYVPKPIYPPLTDSEIRRIADENTHRIKTRRYHSSKLNWIKTAEKYKHYRKIELISLDMLRVIADEGLSGEEILFQQYLSGTITDPSWKKAEGVQKNSLDRLSMSTSGAGNTFYNEESFLAGSFGLYFLLKSDAFSFIEPILMFLEDSGIGTNTRTGKNHFKIIWGKIEVTNNTPGNSFVSLSRYFQNNPFDISKSFYETVFIRSKVHSREEFHSEDVWKDAVIYFKEGSIITPKEKTDRFGGIYPVKSIQGKTIYQYGFAYPFWGKFAQGV
ncbi:MAG: hypothetical protein JRD93_11265 [Deltaproteobacteria bacterium]|nr:hypothetical protein [Deltaproteobacteria bacterium]